MLYIEEKRGKIWVYFFSGSPKFRIFLATLKNYRGNGVLMERNVLFQQSKSLPGTNIEEESCS